MLVLLPLYSLCFIVSTYVHRKPHGADHLPLNWLTISDGSSPSPDNSSAWRVVSTRSGSSASARATPSAPARSLTKSRTCSLDNSKPTSFLGRLSDDTALALLNLGDLEIATLLLELVHTLIRGEVESVLEVDRQGLERPAQVHFVARVDIGARLAGQVQKHEVPLVCGLADPEGLVAR